MKRGTRVEFDNPKNKKRHGKRGVITDMDRGNIWVKLDDGKTVCSRASLLREIGLLDKLAEAAQEGSGE